MNKKVICFKIQPLSLDWLIARITICKFKTQWLDLEVIELIHLTSIILDVSINSITKSESTKKIFYIISFKMIKTDRITNKLINYQF